MLTPEYLIERKHYKKQIRYWKMLVIALLVLAAFIFGSRSKPFDNIHIKDGHIASVEINGVITENPKFERTLVEKVLNNNNAKALIVYINSPGGSITGTERILNVLKDIKKKKPIVAVMGTLAASGGYIVALPADHIVAHNSTLTGSIGVILETAEVTELASKVGITFNNFRSTPLKAGIGLSEKVTPEVEANIMSTIIDMHNYVMDLVCEHRGIPRDDVSKIADGRIYTGRQAYELKLVDEIGTVESATKWLHENKKIDKNLRVIELHQGGGFKIIDSIYKDLEQRVMSLFRSGFMSMHK